MSIERAAITGNVTVLDVHSRLFGVRSSRLRGWLDFGGDDLGENTIASSSFDAVLLESAAVDGDLVFARGTISHTLDLRNAVINGSLRLGSRNTDGQPSRIRRIVGQELTAEKGIVFATVHVEKGHLDGVELRSVDLAGARFSSLKCNPGSQIDGDFDVSFAKCETISLQGIDLRGTLHAVEAEVGTLWVLPVDGQGSHLGGLTLTKARLGSCSIIAALSNSAKVLVSDTHVNRDARFNLVLPSDSNEGVEIDASSLVSGGSLVVKALAENGRNPADPGELADAIRNAKGGSVSRLDITRASIGRDLDLSGLSISGDALLAELALGGHLRCREIAIEGVLILNHSQVDGGLFEGESPVAGGGVEATDCRLGVVRIDADQAALSGRGDQGSEPAKFRFRGTEMQRLEIRAHSIDSADGLLDLREATFGVPRFSLGNRRGAAAIVPILDRLPPELATREVYARFVQDRQQRGLQKETNAIWLAGQQRHAERWHWVLLGWWCGFGLFWGVPLSALATMFFTLVVMFTFQTRSTELPQQELPSRIHSSRRGRVWRRARGWSCFDAWFLASRYVIPPVSLIGQEWRASSRTVLHGKRHGFPRCDTVAKVFSLLSIVMWTLAIGGLLNLVKVPQPL